MMKIVIIIKANETGYSYNEPEGKSEIELDVSEMIAESVDVRELVQTATIGAIREYRAAQTTRGKEESEEESA
jgi:hypothetical protein